MADTTSPQTHRVQPQQRLLISRLAKGYPNPGIGRSLLLTTPNLAVRIQMPGTPVQGTGMEHSLLHRDILCHIRLVVRSRECPNAAATQSRIPYPGIVDQY